MNKNKIQIESSFPYYTDIPQNPFSVLNTDSEQSFKIIQNSKKEQSKAAYSGDKMLTRRKKYSRDLTTCDSFLTFFNDFKIHLENKNRNFYMHNKELNSKFTQYYNTVFSPSFAVSNKKLKVDCFNIWKELNEKERIFFYKSYCNHKNKINSNCSLIQVSNTHKLLNTQPELKKIKGKTPTLSELPLNEENQSINLSKYQDKIQANKIINKKILADIPSSDKNNNHDNSINNDHMDKSDKIDILGLKHSDTETEVISKLLDLKRDISPFSFFVKDFYENKINESSIPDNASLKKIKQLKDNYDKKFLKSIECNKKISELWSSLKRVQKKYYYDKAKLTKENLQKICDVQVNTNEIQEEEKSGISNILTKESVVTPKNSVLKNDSFCPSSQNQDSNNKNQSNIEIINSKISSTKKQKNFLKQGPNLLYNKAHINSKEFFKKIGKNFRSSDDLIYLNVPTKKTTEKEKNNPKEGFVENERDNDEKEQGKQNNKNKQIDLSSSVKPDILINLNEKDENKIKHKNNENKEITIIVDKRKNKIIDDDLKNNHETNLMTPNKTQCDNNHKGNNNNIKLNSDMIKSYKKVDLVIDHNIPSHISKNKSKVYSLLSDSDNERMDESEIEEPIIQIQNKKKKQHEGAGNEKKVIELLFSDSNDEDYSFSESESSLIRSHCELGASDDSEFTLGLSNRDKQAVFSDDDIYENPAFDYFSINENNLNNSNNVDSNITLQENSVKSINFETKQVKYSLQLKNDKNGLRLSLSVYPFLEFFVKNIYFKELKKVTFFRAYYKLDRKLILQKFPRIFAKYFKFIDYDRLRNKYLITLENKKANADYEISFSYVRPNNIDEILFGYRKKLNSIVIEKENLGFQLQVLNAKNIEILKEVFIFDENDV